MRPTGIKIKCIFVFAGLFLFVFVLTAQDELLNKTIKLTGISLKTSKVLEEISLSTGYNFTYDTKMVDGEKRLSLAPKGSTLKELLDSVSFGQSLKYSIIGNHIILFRDESPVTQDTSFENSPTELFISGTISDEKTGDPLSFATIGIYRKAKGTITNNNGVFILKLPFAFLDDTVTISYVGYSNRFMPVRSLIENNMVIKMEQSFISIPEIIIKAQDPLAIISKATTRIPENYGTTPAILTGFYREGIFKKQEPQIYSEAVIQVFKSAYARSLLGDQIKILRSRKIENLTMKDTLALRLRAGLNTCLVLDGVRNYFDFTDPSRIVFYKYHFRDMVNIDGGKAFVISFEQKPGINESLFRGDIYINSEDYGIIQAEFEIDPAFIHLSKESFISRLPAGYSLKPVSVKYRVRYCKINGRYFISHVRGDLEFAARSKRSLFNSRFRVFLEVAYTDFNTGNVQRFDRDETMPPYTVFTETITGYDNEFWKDFNFLKPEDDILDEVEELKARLRVSGIQDN